MMNSCIRKKKATPTRRDFVRRLVQLLTYGGLSHFSLSGNQAMAANTETNAHVDCQGGAPTADICTPPEDYDYCPGETSATDVCPDNGNRNEDICNTTIADADICNPLLDRTSDQCTSGNPKDDLCHNPGNPKDNGDDYCYSGIHLDDNCPTDGGIYAGDDCPGGIPKTDTCFPEGIGVSGGDECSLGKWSSLGANEDDCKPNDADECGNLASPGDDDTCLSGKNVPYTIGANGFDDWCEGDIRASDSCWTGTNDDDLCESKETEDGVFDECPGGDNTLDRCENGISDDYCITKIETTDICPDGKPPEDACATGIRSEDVCHAYQIDSDECDTNISGGDEEECERSFNNDICHMLDDCISNMIMDVVE